MALIPPTETASPIADVMASHPAQSCQGGIACAFEHPLAINWDSDLSASSSYGPHVVCRPSEIEITRKHPRGLRRVRGMGQLGTIRSQSRSPFLLTSPMPT